LNIYDFSVKTIEGEDLRLSHFKNMTLLIVNVASRCGFTPQYKELEALYQKYKDRGFTILAFPCNQFGFQERSSNAQIQEFCQLNYHLSFPLFSKIKVNGKQADPLYTFLKSQQSGIFGTKDIKWNFTKFLINKDGNVVKRYAPTSSFSDIEKEIEIFTENLP